MDGKLGAGKTDADPPRMENEWQLALRSGRLLTRHNLLFELRDDVETILKEIVLNKQSRLSQSFRTTVTSQISRFNQ